MSKIEVNAIEPQCGTNLTVGASGDTITFPSGTTVVNNGSQTGFGRTGTVDWDTTAKTASFTAVSGTGYFVNTTSGAITATLPATPSAGDIVGFNDYARNFGTNNLTIARNGSLIQGAATDATISTNGQSLMFVYVDATQGWIPTEDQTTGAYNATFIVATGGTITCCGDYKIHTFTGPGTFTVCSVGNPAGSDTIQTLIVAGGGGGSADQGGGGGGGGYIETPATPVTAQGYPIVIGSGGTGGPAPGANKGTQGSNSTAISLTAIGGGVGGTGDGDGTADPGGSGGGGRANRSPGAAGTGTQPSQPGDSGTFGFGNPGGPNPGATGQATGRSAGGGGAGGVGEAATAPATPGGAGGVGKTSNISGFSVAYAGGGGGSGPPSTKGPGSPCGTGGAAGGSCNPCAGSNGTTNRGGGGGGGQPGGAGGSGIVIIRYKYQ
jgi:hypothetical protein